MANADSPVDNGVNVEALIAAREALTNAPEAAHFKWRAACEWKNGTHSHSTVEGFFGLGACLGNGPNGWFEMVRGLVGHSEHHVTPWLSRV